MKNFIVVVALLAAAGSANAEGQNLQFKITYPNVLDAPATWDGVQEFSATSPIGQSAKVRVLNDSGPSIRLGVEVRQPKTKMVKLDPGQQVELPRAGDSDRYTADCQLVVGQSCTVAPANSTILFSITRTK